MKEFTEKLLHFFRIRYVAPRGNAGGGRRRHPRKRVFNLIKFTLADGTRYESISNILDLSEKGLQFSCYQALPLQARLRMQIHVPEQRQDVSLVARVAWVRKVKRIKGVFIAGVTFETIAEEDYHILRSLLLKGDTKLS